MEKKLELILLIDDNDDDNFFHKRAIQKSGITCHVDVCTSGDMALDYLANQGEYTSRGIAYPSPSLIFLDINMPRVDGWQFMEQYKVWLEDRQLEAAPIIVMLSTSINPSDRKRAEAMDYVKEYVTKPLKSDKFIEFVKKYYPNDCIPVT